VLGLGAGVVPGLGLGLGAGVVPGLGLGLGAGVVPGLGFGFGLGFVVPEAEPPKLCIRLRGKFSQPVRAMVVRAKGCFSRNENRWLCTGIRTGRRFDRTPIRDDARLMRGNNPVRVLIVMRGTVGLGLGVGLVFDGVVGFAFGFGFGFGFGAGVVAVALLVACGPLGFPCLALVDPPPCAKLLTGKANHPKAATAITALVLNCPLSPAIAPPPIYLIRQFCKEINLNFDEFSRLLFHVFFGNFAAGLLFGPKRC
jgi:hypothetical protein